jgi:hypothetical protein
VLSACSLGLSATSQQYFSLRTNQPPATSRNQPAVLFSQNKPAQAISHQPTEQVLYCELKHVLNMNWSEYYVVWSVISGSSFCYVIAPFTCDVKLLCSSFTCECDTVYLAYIHVQYVHF